MTDIVNPKDISILKDMDEVFSFIDNKYGSPPNWTRPQGFVSLSMIILEQQVSLASAKAHFSRLDHYLPGFNPTNILGLTDEEMRNCHISRQKSKYLRALSTAILNEDIKLEALQNRDCSDVRKQLTQIKGIGDWTADIYLMFCLQAKDIFPFKDIAVINAVTELCKPQREKDILLMAKRWKPLRSLAAYYFWHYYLKKRNRHSG